MKPVDPVKTARIALRVAKNSLKRADGGRTLDKSGFFSKAEEVAKNLPQQRGNVDQMLAMMAKSGVKPAELLHAGKPFGHSISREELARHFGDKKPKIKVTKYARDEEDTTRYSDYSLHGGDDYREHLLHLPSNADPNDPSLRMRMTNTPDGGTGMVKKVPFGDYQSSHWADTPNVLAHVRMQNFKHPIESPEYEEAKKKHADAAQGRIAAHDVLKEAHAIHGSLWREEPSVFNASLDRKEKAGKNYEQAALEEVRAKKALNSMPHEKILHLEELQSDWGQEGRSKGFYDPKNPVTLYKAKAPDYRREDEEVVGHFPDKDAVDEHLKSIFEKEGPSDDYRSVSRKPGNTIEEPPIGPFVGNTQHWTDLGLKHVLHEAAKGKHDKISWTPGEEHVSRFGIGNHIGEIVYDPKNKVFEARNPRGMSIHFDDGADKDKIKNYVGKELAEKLFNTELAPHRYGDKHSRYLYGDHNGETQVHKLSGMDLKVGGEGMRKYYDEILPKSLLKLARQHDPDAKLVPHVIKQPKDRHNPGGNETRDLNTQALVITPKMRESILKGQSLFSHGGMVQKYASGGAVDPDPTDAQKEVGNYKKEHISFQGIPVSIENKKGSMRSGTSKNGRHWSVEMPYDYGYVKGTKGADGDHVDVCIGPNADSDTVFVVDQKDANTGKFDEHKAMLGYRSLADAEKAYCLGFSDGKGHLRMGPIVRMTISEFKSWLKTEETKTANKKQSLVDNALKLVRRQ